MSWLNLNQSFNSLKGQITNFASEVLSENPDEDNVDGASVVEPQAKALEARCRNQELEIASLKKLTEELQASLQSERLSRKNGIKEEESSWYWDPPPQTNTDQNIDNTYQVQIRQLQNEITTMRERSTIDLRPDNDEELHRLREENQNLTANLEDLDNQHQLAMERLLTLKKELQKNFEVLKHEHEDLKNSNDEFGAEIKSLLGKIGERDKEIQILKDSKSDYDTLYHKYQNLERVHSLLKENAEKFQEENQELHEEVFRLQEQVTKMEHEIEVSSKHSDLTEMVPRERYEEILKELNDLRSNRHSSRDNFDEMNIDDNAKSVIENLKRDINELKHKLTQKDTIVQENEENKIIRPERIMQLYNKYVSFELPVDYVGEIPSSGDNIVLYKLESVFKTVNSFKKHIDVLEQKISEKNLNINHLQAQIDDLTTENDFLSTDLQHFEGELNDMKKNNDFLISEIAALKNTSKLEPIIETHEDNYAKMENELADCNRINKTFESEIKRIEKELAAVRNEKVLLHDSLHDLKTKYTTMLSELEMCRTQTKEVEELENTTNQQQSEKIKKTADVIDDLKKRLNASNAKNEQLSIDIHIIENDKVLLTKKVDDLKNTLEEKSSAHKELESLKMTLDHKLHDFECKLDEVIKHKQEIENDKVNLEQKVTVLETELSSKENSSMSNLDSMTTEKMQLSENLSEIANKNSSLIETIDKLTAEVTVLQQQKQELLTENVILKNNTKAEMEGIESLKQIIDDLKGKVIQHEDLSNEIQTLKDEKHKLIEKKLQLEAELSSTDMKIVHLEEEFEKLIADLNEKDTLIDGLNSTISQNNASLSALGQNVADLENSVTIKNEGIQRLRQSLDDINNKYNESNQLSSHCKEELKKINTEKEEMSKQIFSLNDELNSKNTQISNLTNRFEDIEKTCHEYKVTIHNKDKEIKELNQSIVEHTDKIKITDNTTHQNDEYAKLVQDKETIEKEVVELQNIIVVKDKELLELKANSEQFEKVFGEYKCALDNATTEKTELINLITLKHNESIQYHNEIQRLNHVLLEQTNEFKRVIEEKDSLIQNCSQSCLNCEILRVTLKEKDEIIINLNQNVTDSERVKAELSNATDSVRSLTERCDNLDKSMAIQLEMVKKLTAENAQLSELEQNSARELERLRHHLMETEEAYTQELMTSEQKLTECQVRLQQVEDRAKQTSTVYTSNSIRANQEVETLRNQIKLLEKQREEVQAKLSDADDARSRSEAALTNLQVVLEQFQLDKEREIQAVTEKIRNRTEEIKLQNRDLHIEIARLNRKLEESLAGLQAATRLGDQVETKSAQIYDLKEQVRTLQTSVAAAEERYYNAISNQQDKIDKNLVKNLVINYVQTAAHNNVNKTQVLRVLSTILDFNQQECEKLGLVRSGNATDSLAAEFVKFLQNESRPRPTLPNMMGLTQPSSRSTTPSSRKNSTGGPQPSPFELGHKRNPSTGSNNLLFQNIDSVETASQISRDSDKDPRVPSSLDTGVNQTRNTEGAILKYVLKDM